MAGGPENELNSDREAGRAAGQVTGPSLGSLGAMSGASGLGTVAEAMYAAYQPSIMDLAAAASGLAGPSIAEVAGNAGRFVTCEPELTAAVLGQFAGTIGPTEAEMAKSTGQFIMPGDTISAALGQFNGIVGLTAVELAARLGTLDQIAQVMNQAGPSVARQVEHYFAEEEGRAQEHAKGLQALLSPFSSTEMRAAAKAAMWPLLGTVDLPRGRPGSTRAAALLLPYRGTDEIDVDQNAQESGLYIPTTDGVILLGERAWRRGRGRPSGPSVTRDDLLNRLANRVRQLLRYSSDPPVRGVVKGTGMGVATVYTYFVNEAFDWPGGRIGWPTVLRVIVKHLETGRDCSELLAEL